LKFKNWAFEAFHEFKRTIEIKTRQKMKALRINNGGKYNLIEFNKFCNKVGSMRELNIKYSISKMVW